MNVLSCLLLAGIGSFLSRFAPPTGVMSPWKGTALAPDLVLFTCEQTGERNEIPVIANVQKFRSRVKAYWPRPIGASRKMKNGRYGINYAADVEHEVWVRAEPALTNGETRVFTMPDDRPVSFTYRADAPSPLFKIDQLGYVPEAAEKYAYVGGWFGLAGGWEPKTEEEKAKAGGDDLLTPDDEKPPFFDFTPAAFTLVDEATGRTVLTGVPKLRQADPRTQDGSPWVGERPYELDFSSVRTPGRYHLEIDGLGRSDSFVIGREAIANAFAVHMAGVRRQRCGEKCHRLVYRGTFPPNDFHYGKDADGKRRCGFYNSKGESIEVNRFRLIHDNAEVWKKNGRVLAAGGWHDAADYDRRPQHLRGVCDFAGLALIRPACTSAVEEAYWGLKHLITVQQADGGVGSWLETMSHPGVGESPFTEDKRDQYFTSLATRESTLEYCAHAAMTALALPEADPRRKELTDSAIRAWKFCHASPRATATYVYAGEKITYREPEDLPGDMLLKAGLDLSVLTGDDEYMKPVLDEVERVTVVMTGGNWWWSPFRMIELDLFNRKLDREFETCYRAWKSQLLQNADWMLDQLEKSWAYRTPWYGPEIVHAKNLGWGFGLPLTRARHLIVAHAVTMNRKYLDGAYLAVNFHNGCNPEGETYTSGLGIRPTRRYLDLEGLYPPGVTPYRLIGGLEWGWVKLCFPDAIWREWPVWRRYHNVEVLTVRNTEFTVWETMIPAAVVTGYLACDEEPQQGDWTGGEDWP